MKSWKNWIWAALGLFALGLRFLAGLFPDQTDQIYSRALFPLLREFIDTTLGRLPFPSVYFFFLSVLLVVYFFFRRLRLKKSWQSKIKYSFQALANGTGALTFFFLVLWGFHYQRTPIPDQLGLKVNPLSLEELKQEVVITHDLARGYRDLISSDTIAIEGTEAYSDLEKKVRENLKNHLFVLGLEYKGKPRTKLFPPPGMMRRMGILGIYWPFTGESYIDPTLHHLEKPFTIAHEMAHSFGVTNEGEANFVAWVICNRSEDPLLQYSAQLRLLIYLLRDYSRLAPDDYRIWLPNLDRGIVNDIVSIREQGNKYPPFSIEFSRKSNDIFLKSQGVKAGIKSYSQLPMLVRAWRVKN